MRIKEIVAFVTDKDNFQTLEDYIDFSKKYLDYIDNKIQAIIISQNENNYCFYQYSEDAEFQITRPINSDLMLSINRFEESTSEYLTILSNIREIDKRKKLFRKVLNNVTYTIQQSIGASLDALPRGKSNTARKLNGDLFERLIQLILQEIGLDCKAGVMKIPVIEKGEEIFKMSYQHDLIIKQNEEIKILGSVKTSSKDRIDKIFIDKFLYNKLTGTTVPHIAIFLNDVQRKKTKSENQYRINSTFLPGHFKGYTIKLNPLDGVYYCDIRPNMRTEEILKDHIKTFDKLLVTDIWKLLK